MMEFLKLLSDERFLEWFFIILAIVIVVMIKGVVSIVQTSIRERMRREIAAYVAEGSMTPEQGEKLLRAGNGGSDPQATTYSSENEPHAVSVGGMGDPAAAARASRSAQRAARRGVCS